MDKLYCLEFGCRFERKEKKNKKIAMTQCTTCHKWYHDECVGIDSETTLTGWPCPTCRSVSTHVKQLVNMIQQLVSTVNEIQENVQKTQQSLETTSAEVKKTQQCLDVTNAEVIITKKKCDSLLTENASLRLISQNVDKICTEQIQTESLLKSLDLRTQRIMEKIAPETTDSDAETDDEDEEDFQQATGNFLIGDSMVRDVLPLSGNLTVESHGGAKFNDLRKCLKQMNPKKRRFKNIYIVCGTNDVSTKKPIDRISKECEKVLQEAKLRAETVHLSSILPRMDQQSYEAKIDTLNQTLLTLADSQGAKFINNDENFKYRDNTTDASLLLPTDRLHLSTNGVMKLLQNLKLDEEAKAATGNPINRWHNRKQATRAEDDSNCNKHRTAVPLSISVPFQPGERPMHSNTDRNIASNQHQTSTERRSAIDTQELRFRGGRSPLSNFYETPITVWGIQFRSSEHSYQYRKAIAMNQPHAANEVLNARTPREAKSIGNNIETDHGWKNIKQGVMYQILREKAVQCQVFHDCLKETQSKVLIEDTENDFWGSGKRGDGLNMLGQLLMSLRNNLPGIHRRTPSTVSHRTDSVQSNIPNRRRDQIRCFNCGEQSHTIAKCRHTRPLQCFACLGEGHKQKICPQKTREDSDHRSRNLY